MLEQIASDTLEKICRRLLEYDPNIAEIVQFGSSVYASKYAKDIDLLVTTKEEKDYSGYLDSVDELNLPFDVDIVVKKTGDKLKNSFACQVLGAFEILYGDGGHLVEMTANFDPDFEEARAYIRGAKEYLELAKRTENKYDRDRNIRTAFNSLFHASRIAAMAFLSTKNVRWGRVKRRLLQPYRDKFDEFINILHIKHFYNGDYPQDFEREFDKWHTEVESFVKELEKERCR